MLLKANKLLKLFMIRRLKDEVERLMPKKIETKVRINFCAFAWCALGSSHHKMSRSLTLKNSACVPLSRYFAHSPRHKSFGTRDFS